MSFDFSSISPTANTIATSAYIDFLPSLQYLKPLGTSRFLKTNQCLSSNGYVIVKVLVKPAAFDISMQPFLEKLNQIKEKLKNIPNTLPYNALIDSERATYLIRPYGRYSLFERLSIRPFFENIEKKWIVYQLLLTLARMHDAGVCHGDLKSENILLTSWNWVMISDIGLFKPVFLPDHNQSQFSFYFDTSHRHSCNIAPERFKSPSEIQQLVDEDISLDPKSDIFSLGCVIAELYNDGLPIFSLPQMFKYKNNDYVPNLDGIEDVNVRNLIQSMISLDPNDRLTAKEYLTKFRKSLFPDFFYTFLYSYMKTLSDTTPKKSDITSNFQLCDYRIDMMYKDFDKIALYLGFKKNIIENDESTDNLHSSNTIIPMKLNLPGMKCHIPQSTSKIMKSDPTNDSQSLILLTLLCHTTRNTTHSSFRVKACELILSFAEQLHDEAKLDRCLPYLINMLDDPSENVQVAALLCMTQLLTMVDAVTPINIHLFQEYIIPKLHSFLRRSYFHVSKDQEILNSSKYLDNYMDTDTNYKHTPGSYVRIVFASCLPHLAVVAKKFFEMSSLLKSNHTQLTSDLDISLINGGNIHKSDGFDSVENHFENLTVQIMTDPDANVKIALMNNMKILCAFFGKDKTNDVILSHLITYLNDKNPQLKLALISCIVPLAIFVGDVSLQQYLLPLLVQAVNDPDEVIVGHLLKVFSQLILLGLIKQECFEDLVNICVVLILHPVSLVRQSALNLIMNIGNQLSMADFYCILYPLVRPFFQQEVLTFDWKSLHIAAHEPIMKNVFEYLKSWYITSQESLFWQKVNGNNVKSTLDSFGNTKILFLKKNNKVTGNSLHQQSNNGIQDFVSNYEIPLSNSDIKYINKLKLIGLDTENLWKIATIRAYIYRVMLVQMRLPNQNNVTKLIVSPRTVFADVKHSNDRKSKKYDNASNSNDEQIDTPLRNLPNSGPLRLKTLETLKPIVTTNGTITFANAAQPNTSTLTETSLFPDIDGFNALDETVQLKKLTTDVTFGYPGKNQYIWKFLKSIKYKPTINDYPEFGELIEKNASKPDVIAKNLMITRLTEHKAPISDITVAPDSRFFISVDNHNVLKIWDCQRLEVDIIGESAFTVKFDCKINSICFMADRNCFVIAKSDGSIDIFRVNFKDSSLNNNNSRTSTSISRIRHYKLDSIHEDAMKLDVKSTSDKSTIYCITRANYLIVIDIAEMQNTKSILLNGLHGYAKAFAIDPNEKWAFIGTSSGILDLIDLDSSLYVKSTKFKQAPFPIKHIDLLDGQKNAKNVVIVGGTGKSEVIIWNVAKCCPTTILSSDKNDMPSIGEKYSVYDIHENDGLQFDKGVSLKKKLELDNSFTAICSHKVDEKSAWIISADRTQKVIRWETNNYAKSKVVTSKTMESTVFTQKLINSVLSFVQESEAEKSLQNDKDYVQTTVPLDEITSIKTITIPYTMIVCGDRLGNISIYS